MLEVSFFMLLEGGVLSLRKINLYPISIQLDKKRIVMLKLFSLYILSLWLDIDPSNYEYNCLAREGRLDDAEPNK